MAGGGIKGSRWSSNSLKWLVWLPGQGVSQPASVSPMRHPGKRFEQPALTFLRIGVRRSVTPSSRRRPTPPRSAHRRLRPTGCLIASGDPRISKRVTNQVRFLRWTSRRGHRIMHPFGHSAVEYPGTSSWAVTPETTDVRNGWAGGRLLIRRTLTLTGRLVSCTK